MPIARSPARLELSGEPWFPGLAANLVRKFEQGSGVRRSEYSSERWIAGDFGLPLRTFGDAGSSAGPMRVECPSNLLEKRLRSLGLELASSVGKAEFALLNKAIARIARVPGLLDSVRALVWSLHVIGPTEPGYDVSHSNPSLPFSVFVSVPTSEKMGELRLAESIVHEAMHLQLTLIEAGGPLVREEDGATLHSPWQGTSRPIGGILHGFYVFVVVTAFLSAIAQQSSGEERQFIRKRRRQITNELKAVHQVRDHPGLTSAGNAFVRNLMGRIATAS